MNNAKALKLASRLAVLTLRATQPTPRLDTPRRLRRNARAIAKTLKARAEGGAAYRGHNGKAKPPRAKRAWGRTPSLVRPVPGGPRYYTRAGQCYKPKHGLDSRWSRRLQAQRTKREGKKAARAALAQARQYNAAVETAAYEDRRVWPTAERPQAWRPWSGRTVPA